VNRSNDHLSYGGKPQQHSTRDTDRLLERARKRTREELLKGAGQAASHPLVGTLLIYGVTVPQARPYPN
jgi:hypothetical protein